MLANISDSDMSNKQNLDRWYPSIRNFYLVIGLLSGKRKYLIDLVSVRINRLYIKGPNENKTFWGATKKSQCVVVTDLSPFEISQFSFMSRLTEMYFWENVSLLLHVRVFCSTKPVHGLVLTFSYKLLTMAFY